MKNDDHARIKPDTQKEKKENFIVRYFKWIANGTQRANQQGRGPCKY
nr:hypothetical protein [uncultured Desulfobacter sp.]